MKEEKKAYRHKGKLFNATFMIPESIDEILGMMTEQEAYDCFLLGYRLKQKQLATGYKPKTKKWIKIDLTKLTEDQKKILLTLNV